MGGEAEPSRCTRPPAPSGVQSFRVERPRLLILPEFTELEWTIIPLLEEWAEVASYDAPGVGDEAVTDAELMTNIESADVKQGTQDGQPVWVISLGGEGKSATVTIDAYTGEVLALEVQ